VGQEALAATEKRARRQNALIIFEDESGVSLLPSVRATWAPRGHTPVLHHPFNWKRLSLAGALAYEPDGSDAHLFFELRPGAYNDETLIEFLSELYEAEQRTVLLIWDGLPSHRSRRMSDWVATQRHWLSVERLPGYAPDLNLVVVGARTQFKEEVGIAAIRLVRQRSSQRQPFPVERMVQHGRMASRCPGRSN
jgi:hypothetical protein